MADDLVAMTGMSKSEAEQYLEMAGGDMETAVNLFFSMSGGNEGTSSNSGNTNSNSGWCPDFVGMLWNGDISEAWIDQDLVFDGIGIAQYKNGPCGVLAVIQACLISHRMQNCSTVDLDKPFQDDEIGYVLGNIIKQCSSGSECSIYSCKTAGNIKDGVNENSIKNDQVENFMLENIDSYCGKGGLLLLLFSCIKTRTPDIIQRDVFSGLGELPLIVGSNFLCTSELMMLLLTGKANGSIGAYNNDGSKRVGDLEIPSKVGLLSFQELETGVPVHDKLKSPQVPVWILHSGDHFTVLFEFSKEKGEYIHFNGLKPGGPRLSKVCIKYESIIEKAPEKHQETGFKPVIGEIEDIVQACSKDKTERPNDWTSWKYEIVLAVDDPDVTGPERPKDLPEPKIFDQGEPDLESPWRCSSCYRGRFKTMCFGENPANSLCKFCNQARKDAGWSLWVPYTQLPSDWQKKMSRRYAPKFVSLMQTKFENVDVELISSSTDSKELPVV